MLYMGIAESSQYKILIRTNSKILFEFVGDVQSRAIPSYGFSEIRNDTGIELAHLKYDFEIEIRETTDKDHRIDFDERKHRIFVQFSSSDYIKNDAELLLLYLFAQLYQRSNIYCVYGVGMQNLAGKGILIFGDRGAGKSIVELSLLLQGYKWIGNDRILIREHCGEATMSEGSMPIRLRTGTLKSYFSSFLSELPESKNPWETFQSFNPHQLGFQQSKEAKVNYVFNVKVCPIQDQYCTQGLMSEMYGRFASVKLYQYISYFLTDYSIIHLGLMEPYPPFDSQDFAKRRLKLADKILQQAESYDLFGSLKWVTDTIKSITRGVSS